MDQRETGAAKVPGAPAGRSAGSGKADGRSAGRSPGEEPPTGSPGAGRTGTDESLGGGRQRDDGAEGRGKRAGQKRQGARQLDGTVGEGGGGVDLGVFDLQHHAMGAAGVAPASDGLNMRQHGLLAIDVLQLQFTVSGPGLWFGLLGDLQQDRLLASRHTSIIGRVLLKSK